jgi:NAD(P)-dependent dehydrogenase (short-subunit alcohol dehydrogenase family)
MLGMKDKIVIVTGGGAGVGRAAAHAFAEAGARVTIADVNRDTGEETVRKIEFAGGKGVFVEADISTSAGASKIVSTSVAHFGGIDVLFNNAGIQPIASYANAENLSEDVWDQVMAVNVKGAFLMAKNAIPEMKRRGGGVIINNVSVQGLQSQKLVPAYAASKGALLSLTRNLALDYAEHNIRVLAVCPGTVDTPLLWGVARHFFPQDTASAIATLGSKHPLGRVARPEEVAQVVVFLASEGASFMTGSHVCIDGGLMAKGSWND